MRSMLFVPTGPVARKSFVMTFLSPLLPPNESETSGSSVLDAMCGGGP